MGFYLILIVFLNLPVSQRKITSIVTEELKKILETEISIGKIDLGLLNRIIIDDVLLEDKTGSEMLKITRLSAKFDILPLLHGKISIGSVQLFGFNINLLKENPQAEPNFKFVLDAFASQNTVKKSPDIDLRINSILIRRGKISYDVLSEPETPERFNSDHINIQNIIANISLKAINKDSLNGYIKRLSFEEQSGFELNKLSLKVLANHQHLLFENFSVNLPETSINMDTIRLDYSGLEAFNSIADSVRFSGKLLPSHIALQDISAFVPGFSNFQDKINLYFEFDGRLNQLNFPRLELNADNDIYLLGEVSFQDLSLGKDAYVYGSLPRLYISRQGMDMLLRNLSNKYISTPEVLMKLGDMSFNGEISGYFNDIVTYGVFRTDLGTVNADVKWSADQEKERISTSGSLKTNGFELGKLTGQEDLLGKLSFNLEVSSTQYAGQSPRVNLKGLIPYFELKEYAYKGIELDGEYNKGGFDGKIILNDDNANLSLNGSFNTEKEIPEFNFHAVLQDISLHNLNLTPNYKDTRFSLNLNANFAGNSIDNVIGEIKVDSFSFVAPDNYYFLDNLTILADRIEDKNRLIINSDFLTAEVNGNYSYRTIPASIIKTVERYIPSLLSLNRELKEPENNFSFDIHLYNSTILSEVFNIPLYLNSPSTVKGYFNDMAKKIRIEGYFPAFRYGKQTFESGVILCENPADKFHAQIRVSNKKEYSVINLSVEAQAQNDILETAVNWGNNSTITHSGKIAAITNFFKTEGDKPILQANIEIQPTEIILNDSIWNIHPAHIAVDSGKIYVDNFRLMHKEQFLHIDGKLTQEPTDTVKVNLNDIDVGYIFEIAQIDDVSFTGLASGTLFVNQVLKNPEINTQLTLKGLSLNNGLLGDAKIFGKWDKEAGGIYLNAHIREENISQTLVDGHILIRDKGLDLRVDAAETNIKFIEKYTKDILSNLRGRVNGKVRLYGGFKSLNLEGDLLADAFFKINVLNTSYTVRDSVHMRPDNIEFTNVRIYDNEEHSGIINGYLHHRSFKDLNYRIHANIDNMLVYDAKEDPDMPFYGTVYASGNAVIDGNTSRLNVDVNMTPNRNTTFVYLLNSVATATSNQFITFVDKTPRRNVYGNNNREEDYFQEIHQDNPIDIRLNLQVNAAPDATVRIIMDETTGDYISAKGSGDLLVDFYNKGDVRIFGAYTLEQGLYKFSLREVIRKDFIINSGSTIQFNGDPMNANLDIQAIYTANSVSLTDLGIDGLTQHARVNCIMNLSGNLTNPILGFDIDLPYAGEEERQMVRNAISTEEQMNMQIIYLLAIGKFYMSDYANNNDQGGSNAMSSMLSSTLSGQLNNMLSQIIDNNNWNFGTTLSTGEKGWTEVEIEGMLSGQLLNNRLLINGNFGYRDNALSNTTNFVGDFDIEYLLTQSGEIRLKAYNQTNDNRFLSYRSMTTQGIGIGYKKDFNAWNELFFWKRKKKKPEIKEEILTNDSITLVPETVNKED